VSTPEPKKHIIFVCWGNICRSPMAERVAQKMADDRGLTEFVFSSAATSRDEIGHAIDPRAQRALRAKGYKTDGHRAHQITADEIGDAYLVVGMEQLHLDIMKRNFAPDTDNLVLITDYDARAVRGSGIEDPWWGGEDGFPVALRKIERGVSGLLDAEGQT